jgi:phosphosulfolactate synthase
MQLSAGAMRAGRYISTMPAIEHRPGSDLPVGTAAYLRDIGVPSLPPRTSPFDPGYDPRTLEGHLEQSAHLIAILKISMACWMVANEAVSRGKLAAARAYGVATVAGGGPFEVAVAQNRLPAYLDLCAAMGFDRIECGQGFTDIPLDPPAVVAMASERGLEVQFELGSKHGGAFTNEAVQALIATGRRWLEADARELVIEARESARGVGLFDEGGRLDRRLADQLAAAFGLGLVAFEAPTKPSQFALLDHFGPAVRLCNVRLEELLRVEIYRRGLHSDAFGKAGLRPARPDRSSTRAVRGG